MRRAFLSEAPALAALHARAFDIPWTARALAGFMGDAGVLSLVEGEPAEGFILLRIMAGEAEVLTLAVDPMSRGMGVGRRLVEAAAVSAGDGGAAFLFLEVAEDNVAALALYRGTGFIEIGCRRGYYRRSGGPPVDALVLKRDLSANASQEGADA